ncbi:glycoside-pentoside-hexuronide (GPH):cation symporter [Paenarthrobacter histidinolovorans]|uniref:glycoside-pentoside-hexuronide (GPH):cation symporter n=1 Tax=Paenarthrobacter histidinolovorans TaxID=43664 RepID=UPI00166CF377|nr:glycoside-pentoside-hexuronide (GPH):cation symporter [Paenarthrobacter histidinolovorans]GGJ22382.1 hypothetical protein GCM10010052_19340 [Paenarthrobacter histidinolovorans]
MSVVAPAPYGTRGIGIKLPEKVAYGVGDIGSNFIYVPLSTFALFYFTDVAGIGAAVAGTILLVGQLLNGATDLVIGYLIDKTSTRWGKARPWVLWTALPLAIAFVAMFSIPANLDENARVAWALVSYTLVTAVFFTASNIAYSALMGLMTTDSRMRVTLTSFRFFAALLTGLVVSVLTLPLVEALGSGQFAWTMAAGIYAMFAIAAMVTVFFGTRERVYAARDGDSSVKQPARVLGSALLHNTYFFLAAGLFLTFYLVTSLMAVGGVYLANDVLGDPSLFGILSAAALLPPLLTIGFMPKLIERFGKRRMFLAGIAVMILSIVVALIAPSNAPLVIACAMVRGLGMVPLMAGIFAIVGDVVDYGEWKFGVRTDGLIYSSVVFGQKVGAGLGGAVGGWLLAAGGYNAALPAQESEVIQAILALSFYIPLLGLVAMGVFVWFLRVERHAPDVQARIVRHAEKAIDPEGGK